MLLDQKVLLLVNRHGADRLILMHVTLDQFLESLGHYLQRLFALGADFWSHDFLLFFRLELSAVLIV